MRRAPLLIAAVALLSACVAPADTHHRPGVDHATATATAPRDHLQATVSIKAGQVEPPATWLDVPVGSTVKLSITSDIADRVVVDGTSLGELAAGKSTDVTFVPVRAGVFELRTANSALVLAQVAATP
jgi:hypothetical protein